MFALKCRLQVWATGAQSCWKPLGGNVGHITELSLSGLSLVERPSIHFWPEKASFKVADLHEDGE